MFIHCYTTLISAIISHCSKFLPNVIRGATHQSVIASYDILVLLEKYDSRLFDKFKHSEHPLYSLLPRYKESSSRLRDRTSVRPHINTKRLKGSFFNRLIFKTV